MIKTPRKLAENRIELAEIYSRYSGELAKLIKIQADYFNSKRNELDNTGKPLFKSDTACQRAFEATTEGVQMSIIKMKLKAIEKQLSATATMLRLLENESKNLY